MSEFIGTLVPVECCNCHMTFGMTPQLNKELRDTHRRFFCPAGHGQVYTGESEAEKLKREINRMKQNEAYLADQIANERDKKNHARHQARALKGVITKVKKRVGSGVCPCCNRSFKSLANHMATKHPEYSKEEVAA